MIRSKYTRDEIIHNKNYPGAGSVIRAIRGEFDFSKIPPKVLEMATQRGSDIHDAIEQYILEGTPFNISQPGLEYEVYFDAFNEWLEKYKPEFLAAELPFIHHDRLYKGIIDCVCKIDGKIVVIDWKTSSNFDVFNARLQQSLYTLALEEVFGIVVDEVRVLSITRSGYKYIKLNYDKQIPISLLYLKGAKDEHDN